MAMTMKEIDNLRCKDCMEKDGIVVDMEQTDGSEDSVCVECPRCHQGGWIEVKQMNTRKISQKFKVTYREKTTGQNVAICIIAQDENDLSRKFDYAIDHCTRNRREDVSIIKAEVMG